MPRDAVSRNGAARSPLTRGGRESVPWLSAARLLFLASLTVLLWAWSGREATAQQADFHPITEEKVKDDEHEERQQNAVVFSFSRFEPTMRLLCGEMEVDSRRLRLFQLAQTRAKAAQDCPSCRALWRTVVSSCRQGSVEERKPSKAKKKKKTPETETEGDEITPEATPTPEPTPTPIVPARYPSTAVVDAASRLSNMMYEQDPEKGGIYQALGHVCSTLTGVPDLTAAEKDYFEILSSYLLAAWEGRSAADGQEESSTSRGSSRESQRKQLNDLFE